MTPLVACVGATGGAGASTLAIAAARALAPGAVLLDLDLAGGALARRLEVPYDPGDPGIAGVDPPSILLARVARPWDCGLVAPATTRPDLAWTVQDGVVLATCTAARRLGRVVVADAGRGVGPALEALLAADVIVLVVGPTLDGIDAAGAQVRALERIGLGGARLRICLNGVQRGRGRAAAAVAARVLGRRIDGVVPHERTLGRGAGLGRARGPVGALLGDIAGARR